MQLTVNISSPTEVVAAITLLQRFAAPVAALTASEVPAPPTEPERLAAEARHDLAQPTHPTLAPPPSLPPGTITHGRVSSDAPGVVVPLHPQQSLPVTTAVHAGGVSGGATAAVVELDDEGTPWDERIHSGGKSKTQAGIWQKRKGVSQDVVNQVRAELHAARGTTPRVVAPTAAIIPPPPPVAAAAPVAPTAPPAPAPVLSPDGKWQWIDNAWQPVQTGPIPPPPLPTMPPVAATPAAPAAPVAPTDGGITWPMICNVVQEKTGKGVPFDTINAISAKYGANPVALAAPKPEIWAQLHAELSAL